MVNYIIWRTPHLICFETKDLICRIKVKATSPLCTFDYTGETACPELSTEATWCNTWGSGDGFDGDVGCGIFSQCIEIGPLFGCSDSLACSSMDSLV